MSFLFALLNIQSPDLYGDTPQVRSDL
jgi:hypothetical protein